MIHSDDIDNKPIELVFFDCHDYDAQMTMYNNLLKEHMINDSTALVLHDTNLHYSKFSSCAQECQDGYIHQEVERRMVNDFKSFGYDAFSLDTNKSKHDNSLPFRHGVTICRKFELFALPNSQNKPKLIINSHSKSLQAQKKLHDNLIEIKLHEHFDIIFVIGDSDVTKKDDADRKDHNNIRWIHVSYNLVDFTAILWASYNLSDNDWIFNVHDTVMFGPRIIDNMNSFEKKTTSLINNPSMNMGTYLISDLKKIAHNLENRYKSMTIKQIKAQGVYDEDIIFKTFKSPVMKNFNMKDVIIKKPYDVYGSGVLRIEEYYPHVDMYKYKANWYIKQSDTMNCEIN